MGYQGRVKNDKEIIKIKYGRYHSIFVGHPAKFIC